MSDVLLSTALRTNDRRLGNGDGVGIHRGAGTGAGAGLSVSDEPSRAEGGVQTTPSVNGTVELNKLKNEVATKAAQLERLDKQVEDYKFKLQKVGSNVMIESITDVGKAGGAFGSPREEVIVGEFQVRVPWDGWFRKPARAIVWVFAVSLDMSLVGSRRTHRTLLSMFVV